MGVEEFHEAAFCLSFPANDANRIHLEKPSRNLVKILVIRFSSIGDIVLTTPVVRALARQIYGGAEIHYLTKEKFATILRPNPHISKVHTIQRSTNEVIRELKDEGYDYIVDLHNNLRSSRVKSALKSLAFTFEKYNWQKWLLVNFGIDKMPDLHIVDRYMATTKAFGIKDDGEGLDYFIPPGAEVPENQVPSSHREGFTAVVIGAAHWRKKPRIAQYISLCEGLSGPVALLGGPEDKADGEEIAAPFRGRVWNAAGAFDLHGSADLVRRARLVVTPDTGLMHIAAAFQKPIVSLWGATVPRFGMYPYRNNALNAMIQADHLTRRPCSKLGTRCKYKPCRCIDELPLQKAVEEANLQTEPAVASPHRDEGARPESN